MAEPIINRHIRDWLYLGAGAAGIWNREHDVANTFHIPSRNSIAGDKRLAGMGTRVQVTVLQCASHDANDMLIKVSR